MKIDFICYIDEAHRHYIGEEKVKEEEASKEFEIEWNPSWPLPVRGDLINLDELFEDVEERWAEIFYDRTWGIDFVVWEYSKEFKTIVPIRVFLKGGEK